MNYVNLRSFASAPATTVVISECRVFTQVVCTFQFKLFSRISPVIYYSKPIKCIPGLEAYSAYPVIAFRRIQSRFCFP